MNLDGGSSSAMAFDGRTVNYPPTTWVRPVASGILVFDDRYPPASPTP
jgi:exopolysaccharide biosynthesis protein